MVNKRMWIYESHIFELRMKTWIWSDLRSNEHYLSSIEIYMSSIYSHWFSSEHVCWITSKCKGRNASYPWKLTWSSSSATSPPLPREKSDHKFVVTHSLSTFAPPIKNGYHHQRILEILKTPVINGPHTFIHVCRELNVLQTLTNIGAYERQVN